MKIGIPTWNDRVSPVLDSAMHLLVIEIDDGRELSRRTVDLPAQRPALKARAIADAGPQLLICGAVSRGLERHLQAYGLTVIPWIRGNVEVVVAAWHAGDLQDSSFMLPGCCGGRRRRHGRSGRVSVDYRERNDKSEEDL